MPLVLAGIQLAFSNKKLLGFAVTTAGLSLHFRENHLQMTYYLLLIVLAYGLVQLIYYFKEKRTAEFFKSVGILVPAVVIAVGTFVGPMWAVTEYTKYSREGSELASSSESAELKGVGKSYAFE